MIWQHLAPIRNTVNQGNYKPKPNQLIFHNDLKIIWTQRSFVNRVLCKFYYISILVLNFSETVKSIVKNDYKKKYDDRKGEDKNVDDVKDVQKIEKYAKNVDKSFGKKALSLM